MAGVARKEGSEVVRTQVVEVDGARPAGPKPLGKLRLFWPAGSTQVRFWEGRRSRGQRTEGEPRRPPPLTTLEGTGQRAGSGASEEGQATGLGGSEEGKVSGAWGSRRRFCSSIHSFIPALINRVSASLTRLSFAQQIEPTMWGKRWVWREMRPITKALTVGTGVRALASGHKEPSGCRFGAGRPPPQELAHPWHPELCAPRGLSEHGKWTSEVQDMLLGGTWVKF